MPRRVLLLGIVFHVHPVSSGEVLVRNECRKRRRLCLMRRRSVLDRTRGVKCGYMYIMYTREIFFHDRGHWGRGVSDVPPQLQQWLRSTECVQLRVQPRIRWAERGPMYSVCSRGVVSEREAKPVSLAFDQPCAVLTLEPVLVHPRILRRRFSPHSRQCDSVPAVQGKPLLPGRRRQLHGNVQGWEILTARIRRRGRLQLPG